MTLAAITRNDFKTICFFSCYRHGPDRDSPRSSANICPQSYLRDLNGAASNSTEYDMVSNCQHRQIHASTALACTAQRRVPQLMIHGNVFSTRYAGQGGRHHFRSHRDANESFHKSVRSPLSYIQRLTGIRQGTPQMAIGRGNEVHSFAGYKLLAQ